MRFLVVDKTGTIAHDELAAYALAQQFQLREHYAKHYDGDGANDVVFVANAAGQSSEVTGDDLMIVSLEHDAPDDGTLGEHDVDTCHVYLALAAKFGQSWTSVASHEVLEARADRRLHACVELDDGTIIDREICDRCEADTYEITVDLSGGGATHLADVEMSNFNTPACFEPTGKPGEIFDHMELSTKPNEVRPGGYAQTLVPGSGWVQRGHMRGYRETLARKGLSRGSRRHRRHQGK